MITASCELRTAKGVRIPWLNFLATSTTEGRYQVDSIVYNNYRLTRAGREELNSFSRLDSRFTVLVIEVGHGYSDFGRTV